MQKSGIYCIENLINGKKYIGQAYNIERRIKDFHKTSVALSNAINKYGNENFKKYIILYCEKWELSRYEISCIKIFNSLCSENGYNISEGGHITFSGKKHSEKTIEKMSGENNFMFGKHHSDETKNKISNNRKGLTAGKNNPMYGKHHSEETKKKISSKRKRFIGKTSPFYGQKHTEITKEKISKTKRNKIWMVP